MTIYGWLIFLLWLTLVAYWVLSAHAVKRSIGSRWLWWREIAIRLGLFAVVVLAVRIAGAAHALPQARLNAINTSALMGLIGFVLAALGIALAILARAYLGRNWGMPMSRKENRELVMSGPYALVRHPIYGGMLLAMLGSALAQSVFWVLPLVVYGPYFILSARQVERHLVQEFGDDYRAYMRRTKLLLPYVL